MKQLSGALANTKENKKKSTTLTETVEAEKTTSRKIFKEDYELLRKYAFFTDTTVTEALDMIYGKLTEDIKTKGTGILLEVTKEEIESEEQKNIRISVNFNKYLKDLSKETKIPAKYLLSVCLDYYKDFLVEEIKKKSEVI